MSLAVALSLLAQDLYADDNLFAWLVMFQDAVERTPDERARMVSGLGFKKAGFEAFDRYVPIFEAQVDAYRRHGVELLSLLLFIRTDRPSREKSVQSILEVVHRRGWRPQIWAAFPRGHLDKLPVAERLPLCVKAFSQLAEATPCPVSLYNYGGWFGETDVQLSIIRAVSRPIGTVFNFHRGHEHISRFADTLGRLKPHLTAVNLNGMKSPGPLILPLGQGDHDLAMLRGLRDSGWSGPIGLIDHRPGIDAAQALRENLAGLSRLRAALSPSD